MVPMPKMIRLELTQRETGEDSAAAAIVDHLDVVRHMTARQIRCLKPLMIQLVKLNENK